MGCAWRAAMARSTVEQISGSVQCFGPKTRRHGGLEEEGTHTIIESAQGALCLAILLASIGARQPEYRAVQGEQFTQGMTVELAPIVSLDRNHEQLKLGASIGIEIT